MLISGPRGIKMRLTEARNSSSRMVIHLRELVHLPSIVCRLVEVQNVSNLFFIGMHGTNIVIATPDAIPVKHRLDAALISVHSFAAVI